MGTGITVIRGRIQSKQHPTSASQMTGPPASSRSVTTDADGGCGPSESERVPERVPERGSLGRRFQRRVRMNGG
jgi:hypothetical protein